MMPCKKSFTGKKYNQSFVNKYIPADSPLPVAGIDQIFLQIEFHVNQTFPYDFDLAAHLCRNNKHAAKHNTTCESTV